MHNLTHVPELQQTQAEKYIALACKGNVERASKFVYGHNVNFHASFTLLADGTYEACLRDADGVVVALANVDASDK